MHLYASVRPQQLLVQYQHSHTGHEPLFLYNHLFDWFGILSGDPMKGAVYNPNLPPTNALAAVYAHGPDGVLLEQGLPPDMPPFVCAYAPRDPLCQRVLPGETVTVTLCLPLPLDEWHPHRPPDPSRAVETWVRTLTMKVTCVPASRTSFVRAHPSWPHLYNVTGSPRDELCATVALDTPIVLRRRTDLSTP